MALNVQPLPLSFASGLDTKTDQKATTKLLDLQNATFIKATTLQKRNGYLALGNMVEGTLVTLAQPQALGVRGTELVKADGAALYSYLPQTDRWSRAGDVTSVTATSDPVARTGGYQQQPDVAANGGCTVVAWEDNLGGVWYSVLETSSKRVVLKPTNIVATGALKPRCLAIGAVLHVIYAVPASQALYVLVVNPAAPLIVNAPQLLVTDLSATNPNYDACVTTYNSDNPGLIAYAVPSGAGYTYKVGYIAPSGVIGSPLTGLPTIAHGNLACTTTIACAWSATAGYPVAVMATGTSAPGYDFYSSALANTDGGSISGTFGNNARRLALAYAGTQLNGDSNLWWALDAGNSDDDTNTVTIGQVTTGDAQVTNAKLIGHGLLSRAFAYNGDAYVTIGRACKFFSYAAVVKLSVTAAAAAQAVVARVLPGQSPGLPARTHLPSANISTSHAFVPLLYKLQLASANGDQFSEVGIRLYNFSFADAAAWQSTQLGRGLYISGACMQHYDGDRVAEADFHGAPDTKTGLAAPVQSTGGALTTTGTYGYMFVYEEIDGQGELHRGPTSVEQNVVLTGSNNSVTWTIPTYALTCKRRVRIGVFRSVANDASQFFRITSTDVTATGANAYLLNDPTVATLTFTDNMSDAVCKTMEPLYTNGGVLSNDPPSYGGSMLVSGMNRLFWNDPDDPQLIRYSQERADETGAETVNALSIRVDPYGGKLTAIGIMDGAVYAFCQTAIYGIVGSGPDATGSSANTSFSPPQLITSDAGCISAGSICQTPIGITFQSSKGIMMLGRDRQVVDIGRDVYAYNSQTVVRATLLPDRHQILFLTNSGRSLLYDYEHEQWSTYTNHTGLDAVVVSGTYYYLRTDGRVFKETPGLFRDDNAHIPMLIETAWIKMAGYLQGWQKVLWVYWLGAYLSQHTLRMKYRIDYQDAYSAPIDIPVDANYMPDLYGAGAYGVGAYGGAGGPNTVYQRRVHLNKRCQAMSLQVYDVESVDNYGAAFQLSELLLIGGVLGPSFKVGAARSG